MQIENIIYNMHNLIERNIKSSFLQYLDIFPAIALLGPRQCGKSTFVKMMSYRFKNFMYLDLQNQDDLNKLNVLSYSLIPINMRLFV